MKIVIAGSRTFGDDPKHRDLCFSVMDTIREMRHNHGDEVEVVSGTARGADKLGEEWARAHKLKLFLFPADWEKFGKSAGYRRNEEMARFADAAVIFWDGHSRGSQHMINLARQYELRLKVVKF